MTSGPFVNVRAALSGVRLVQAGTLFTVDGTGYPGAPAPNPPPGAGFASGIAYGLMNTADGLWAWRGIGYPAAVTPMQSSVNIGRANLVAAITATSGAIALSGYSQGAMVVDQCWVGDFLRPGGVLHHRLSDVVRIYNFGDPQRCPGVANGNLLMGQSLPARQDGQITGGIAGPADLTAEQTPDFFYSFANNGDIYAACPTGADPWTNEATVGRVETNIYDQVQQETFLDVVKMADDLATPIATIEAIINGLQFAAQGTNAPHWQYQHARDTAVADMITLGNHLLKL